MCAADRPDLVLMDLAMPDLDGIEATRRIMSASPCAILVVTASPKDQVGRVFRALGAGALDVTATPLLLGKTSEDKDLLAKIHMIGKLVCGTPEAKPASAPGGAEAISHLIAIGASTGGPMALTSMLADWRPPPSTAIVVVQHIDTAFADHFARWLGDQLAMPVRTIAEGDRLAGGMLQVARTDDHLRLVADGRLHYDPHPRQLVYRPSIDVFFQSVAEYWEAGATGVLLTGMGRDGAAGLLSMRSAGHATIAQDEATSAVYGMPRAAQEIGAAQHILPIDKISSKLRVK
jgi:two-component system response regulator WspF